MANFKPEIRINLKNFKAECTVYSTYRELMRNLIKHLSESYDNEVSISRSRRGQWGEWFEKWGLYNGKPVKLKEGWM